MNNINVIVALLGGIISFFSPCVLPLLPVFVGLWLGSITDTLNSTKRLILSISLFILGFSIVFTLMGFAAGAFGKILTAPAIRIIFGILIILFGFQLAQVIHIPFLEREYRPMLKAQSISPIKSFVMGLGFAFGWSPCIGPVLASILMLASQSKSVFKAGALLFFFSLGLGLPFLLIAFFSGFVMRFIRNIKRYIPIFQLISGKLLAFLGFALITGSLASISEFSAITPGLISAVLVVILILLVEIKFLLSAYEGITGGGADGLIPVWMSRLFFVDFILFGGLYFAGKLVNR